MNDFENNGKFNSLQFYSELQLYAPLIRSQDCDHYSHETWFVVSYVLAASQLKTTLAKLMKINLTSQWARLFIKGNQRVLFPIVVHVASIIMSVTKCWIKILKITPVVKVIWMGCVDFKQVNVMSRNVPIACYVLKVVVVWVLQ